MITPSDTHSCAMCTENTATSLLVELPCSHRSCLDCIRAHFRTATRDEFVFPPRCCGQEIPFSLVESLFTPLERSDYRRAKQEFTSTTRTYCAAPECGVFIPANATEDGKATCNDCGQRTCVACGNLAHGGDCAENTGLEQVFELARLQEWRRCPRCQAMIERISGCLHMTCLCGHTFCYRCGADRDACDHGYGFEQHHATEVPRRHVRPFPGQVAEGIRDAGVNGTAFEPLRGIGYEIVARLEALTTRNVQLIDQLMDVQRMLDRQLDQVAQLRAQRDQLQQALNRVNEEHRQGQQIIKQLEHRVRVRERMIWQKQEFWVLLWCSALALAAIIVPIIMHREG